MTTINYIIYDKMSLYMDNDFSDWLVEQMNKNGWSQSDLANKSGVTRQVIETYVNRKRRNYNPEILTKIAKGLGESQATVFRAAGLLKKVSEITEMEENLLHVFSELPEREKQMYLEYGRFLLSKINNGK